MNTEKPILFLPTYYPNSEAKFVGNFIQNHALALAEKRPVLVLYVKSQKTEKYTHNIQKSQNRLLKEHIYYFPYHSLLIVRFYRKLKCYIELFQLYNKEYSMIHLHVFSGIAILGVLLGKYTGRKLYLTEHNSFFHKMSWVQGLIFKFFSKSICGFGAVSNHMKSTMCAFGIPSENIVITPNVVDTKFFDIQNVYKDSKVHFLHISAYHISRKNIVQILEVAKELSLKYSNFILEIGGDGDRAYLLKQISKVGIERSFLKLSGEYKYSDLPRIYSQADVFVLFSDFENFGVVLAESISCGTPVVTTKVGGVIDFVNENNGILVAVDDKRALYESMEKFIINKIAFDSKAVRASIENYVSQESVLQKMEAMYAIHCP